jgi:hypothetical protein
MKMIRIRAVLAVACCGLGLTGCFGSVEGDLCERADECNALAAGVSVDECTDRSKKCTDALTSAERADWERATQNCLDMQSCSNFVSCYNNVPGC